MVPSAEMQSKDANGIAKVNISGRLALSFTVYICMSSG